MTTQTAAVLANAPFRSSSLADDVAPPEARRSSTSPTRLPCVAHPVYTYHTACGCHRSPEMRSRSASQKLGNGLPPPPPPPPAQAPAFPPYPAVPLTQFDAKVGRFGLLERSAQPSVVLCAETGSADGSKLSCRSPITGEMAVLNHALSSVAGRPDVDVTVVETLPCLWSLEAAGRVVPSKGGSAVWIGFSDGSVACYDGVRESESSCLAVGTLPHAGGAPPQSRSVSFEEPTKPRSGTAPSSAPQTTATTSKKEPVRGVTAIDRGGDDSTYSAHSDGCIFRWTLVGAEPGKCTLAPTLYVRLTSGVSCQACGTLRTSTDVHLLASGALNGSICVWVLGAPLGDDGLPKHADLQLPRQGGKKQVSSVLSLEFSSSSADFLWSGHDDGRIIVWNVRFRTCVGNIDLHRGAVTSISAIGTTMWTVSHAGECLVFDQDSRVVMQRFPLFPLAAGGGASKPSNVRLQRVAQAEGCIVWGSDHEKVRAIFVPEVVSTISRKQQSSVAAMSSETVAIRSASDKSLVDFELMERSAQMDEHFLKLSQLLEEKLTVVSEAGFAAVSVRQNCSDHDAIERSAASQSDEIARLQEELVLLHESLNAAAKLDERRSVEIALLQAEKDQAKMAFAAQLAELKKNQTSTASNDDATASTESHQQQHVSDVYKDLISRLEAENTELNEQVVMLQRELALTRHRLEEAAGAERTDAAADGQHAQLVLDLEGAREELARRSAAVHDLTEQLSNMSSELEARKKSYDMSIDEHVSENKQLVAQLSELTLLLAERQASTSPERQNKEEGPAAVASNELKHLERELEAAQERAAVLESQLRDAEFSNEEAKRRILLQEDEIVSLREDLQSAAEAKQRLEKALAREVEGKRTLEAEIQRLQSLSSSKVQSSVAGQSEALHERLQRQLDTEREQFSSRLQEEEERTRGLESRLKEAQIALAAERSVSAKLQDTVQALEAACKTTQASASEENMVTARELEHKEQELASLRDAHAQELAIAKALLDEAKRRPTSWPRSSQTELVPTSDAQVEANSGTEEALKKELHTARSQLEAAEAQLSELQLQGRDRVASEASVRVEYEERLSALHKQIKDLTQQLHGLQLVSTTNDALRERLVILEAFERENVELRRRLRIEEGEAVELCVTADEHKALQQENQDLLKQLQIHKHHVTRLLENEIVMEKRLVAAMKGQSNPTPRPQAKGVTSPSEDVLSNTASSRNNSGDVGNSGRKGPRSISQLLQSIAPTGQQQHDPTDPHHRSQCMWCSGRIQQSLGGSFGIFAAASPPKHRATARQRSTSPLLTGTIGGALADAKIADRISRLERARDATSNQQIRSAIVAELLALHKSVLPGDN